eukprot:CAMPEP_0172639104 /NCGR_PEP_ID=MMETSP1068-20121228/217004_1 /TAXON_ID=35684 /ORGANISM="Pseudopedinella elastica, Strain CCMP716" /LENGTH=369 /DNA_ID=CAMNT_0013452151 /DNA_START=222 /DNA_END=1331 /DNA_ORIENTATION=-
MIDKLVSPQRHPIPEKLARKAAKPDRPEVKSDARQEATTPFDSVPYLQPLPVDGKLIPTAQDLMRVKLLEKRARTEFTEPMMSALAHWAAYHKGLRALLLQFARARPGKRGVRDIEESFELLSKAARWREEHQVPNIFVRGWPTRDRLELKQRFLTSFFFGTVASTGEPIYYNNMALADREHEDLVPSRFSINDLSIIWVQEMEYREKVIFPKRSEQEGKLVNYMISVMDVKDCGMGRMGLLKYLKPTASLNSHFYPESVRQIFVVNCPGMITWLYSFVKPLVPETTQKKIVFVSGNGHAELLALTRDDSQIPREYGGTGPSTRDIVAGFHHELQTFLEEQAGYDEAPDGEGNSSERAAFQNLAVKDKT